MKISENESIMRQTATFLFTFLSRKENAPFTMSVILMGLMAWWNIKQAAEQSSERHKWNVEMVKKDSVARKERAELYQRIGAQNAEILLCKTAYERLETEIQTLKRELKKR